MCVQCQQFCMSTEILLLFPVTCGLKVTGYYTMAHIIVFTLIFIQHIDMAYSALLRSITLSS